MKYAKLGKTDMTISTISMGCWTIGGGPTWGEPDDTESIATIYAALDTGVNFFDTAEGYGNGRSESILGQALVDHRHEVIIATKVSRRNLAREAVRQACEASLQRLKTDYIDLYQIHWPSRSVPLAETMDVLERLREQGKIRAIGVSNFGVHDLSELLAIGRCETNQLPYNLLWRAIEYEIRQTCADENIGILCYSALAQGLLTGRFSSPDEVPEGRARTRFFSKHRPQVQHGEDGCESELFAAIEEIRHICQKIHEPITKVALAWLLYQPGVTSVIAGARTPDQIKQNVQAVDLELSPEIVSELNDITEELKQILGPNPDMWQSESRFR
jgi:aryl-alcohol dehydrogenase-like predicted oxidoreductase